MKYIPFSVSLSRFEKTLALLVVGVFVGLQFTATVQALSSEQRKALDRDALYFNTEIDICTSGSTGSLSAEGLPNDIIKSIQALQSQYEQASTATGVPWQLLAAIHYRESNNDPNRDMQAGNPIGGPYTNAATYPYGHPTSIEQSAEFAAKQLIEASKTGVVKKPINTTSPDPEAIKDTLFSYNGRADAYAQQAAQLGFDPKTQPYEGSPYVMNNFDAKHTDMKIITHDHGGLDGTDTRYGAYTIYAKLGGATGGGGCSGAAIAGNAVQTAINYAWPTYHNPPYLTMKPSYAAAISKAQGSNEYVGGGSNPGIDCGGFITRVMRDSGADPDYNWGPGSPKQGNTEAQQAYMDAHPEKYDKLGAVTDTKTLLPGDIAINSTHTYMYVGKQTGFSGNSVSASYSETGDSWRSPMASNAYFSNDAGPFIWYRLKK